MTISIAALRAMAAAGATAEMIIAAVEAQQRAAEDVLTVRRRADKERQRRHRDRLSRSSRDGHVSPRDRSQDVARPAANGTTDSVVTARAAPTTAAPQTAQKERSPTPPKEKHYPQGTPSLFFDEGKEEVTEIARARGKRAACRLPDDWQPSLADIAFAKTVLPAASVQLEADKFRDHWHSSNGPPKRDWSAAWRNWCRRAVEIANRNGGNGQYRQSGEGGGGQRKGRGWGAFTLQNARAAGLVDS